MGGDSQAQGKDEIGPISAINVTPFVDVVLVLLVIFVVTAPMIMKDTLGIKLPKSASTDGKGLTSIGIAVTRQGQILFNGEMVSETLLGTKVKETLARNPEAQALISADGDAKHSDVVRAIDLLKTSGMNRFAFEIQRQ